MGNVSNLYRSLGGGNYSISPRGHQAIVDQDAGLMLRFLQPDKGEETNQRSKERCALIDALFRYYWGNTQKYAPLLARLVRISRDDHNGFVRSYGYRHLCNMLIRYASTPEFALSVLSNAPNEHIYIKRHVAAIVRVASQRRVYAYLPEMAWLISETDEKITRSVMASLADILRWAYGDTGRMSDERIRVVMHHDQKVRNEAFAWAWKRIVQRYPDVQDREAKSYADAVLNRKAFAGGEVSCSGGINRSGKGVVLMPPWVNGSAVMDIN